MRKFAERLKNLRMEKQLSIAALSQHVGLSVGSISRWETGQCDIKGDQLILLAKFFDVSVDYLLGLEG
ncbi:MAG: helix-turn-helix transcriptional regulator [Clostridia bacterium]|nr:helix-turn-helix transcriptional regulator [Clostridia bacterium]